MHTAFAWAFIACIRLAMKLQGIHHQYLRLTLSCSHCVTLCDGGGVCVCSIACLQDFNPCAASLSVIFSEKGHLWCHVSCDRPVLRSLLALGQVGRPSTTKGHQLHRKQMVVALCLHPSDMQHGFC